MMHSPCKGKSELPEKGAGKTALQADGCIHRRQRNRHGDNGPHKLAGPQQRRVKGRLAFAEMALDILDNHNGIINHEPHRQHDGQQRQQIYGKSHGPASEKLRR